MDALKCPLLGFCAYSGVGKTTLLESLIPLLIASGLRLGVVKHSHHAVDVDYPGKDSYRLRKAGARQVLLTSGQRWILMTERSTPDGEADLVEALKQMQQDELDLIMVEGFRHAPIPKIELLRAGAGRDPLHPGDPWIIAVATDYALHPQPRIPVLPLNDIAEVAGFILAYCRGTWRPWLPGSA